MVFVHETPECFPTVHEVKDFTATNRSTEWFFLSRCIEFFVWQPNLVTNLYNSNIFVVNLNQGNFDLNFKYAFCLCVLPKENLFYWVFEPNDTNKMEQVDNYYQFDRFNEPNKNEWCKFRLFRIDFESYIYFCWRHTHTTSDLDKTRGEKITRKVQI